jgi:peptidyl-prolyl cis-trans isomerase SurA
MQRREDSDEIRGRGPDLAMQLPPYRHRPPGPLVVALALAAVLAGCTLFDRSAPVVMPDPSEGTGLKAPAPAPRTSGSSSIRVVVNDQPITSYDIAQRARLMRVAGVASSEKAATEELITETLQMYEAAKRGVRVPDRRVEGAFAGIASGLKMSPAQLTAALKGEGIDDSSLKRRLRAQLSWQQLVQERVQTTAKIKTSDITAALQEEGDPSTMTVEEFTLQQIIFVVPSGSSSGLFSQRQQEAAAFRQRFKGCDQSLEQAKQLRGVVVKDIGRRDAGQLTGPAGEEIRKTPVGKAAPPNKIDQGIELIAVCAKRDVRNAAVARAEVQNKLYLDQSEDLGKEYIEELRAAAIIETR